MLWKGGTDSGEYWIPFSAKSEYPEQKASFHLMHDNFTDCTIQTCFKKKKN